jgi:site-specific recombinase XerD
MRDLWQRIPDPGKEPTMTPLRKRMIDEMQLRNYCPKTIQVYVYNVARFARYFEKSPERLGASHVRRYLLHVLQERKASWPTYKQELSALRFLYRYVLKRGDLLLDIRCSRSGRTLPVVLSLDEVRRFFAAIHSYKYRMILMTAYSAGLRISEVINLKVADIDSEGVRSAAMNSMGIVIPWSSWSRM